MITGTALEQDVKRCAEALIDHAVITAEGDRALLEKIRRHAPALQNAFTWFTGWQLQARPEFARLVKTPARAEASHGLGWARGRLDYELLAWVLWYGEHTGGRKFTLSQIAEEIRIRTAAPGGVPGVDWASRDQRLAARRVFRGLEEMGVVRLQDGSAEEWTDENGKRDALYAWGAAAWKLNVAIPPPSWSAWPRAAPPRRIPRRRRERTRSASTAPFSSIPPSSGATTRPPSACSTTPRSAPTWPARSAT